ncbi:hypothetical protein [Nocardia sp. NPDC004860]|uniref:hypothetical protein n=1 Tax=Nocardia sp. NPDC004860 TaxID=3154557 RepID=UPI0033A13657
MKHAMDWHLELLVDAEDAEKSHPGFECPNCWKEVTLARGKINAAYFRHADESPSCPDYHPGISSSSQWTSQHDSRFALRLACTEDKWTLYLKLPELRDTEIAKVTPQSLKGLAVALQHENGDPTIVNGLELWPGSGRSTVTFNPANPILRAYPQGDWPWDPMRWNHAVQNIPAMGAVFCQEMGGDYILCTASRPVYLGRSVVFLARHPVSPPKWITTRRLESHDGFTAWHFAAPCDADSRYSRWLTSLGTALAEIHDLSTFLTPPIDYGNDETHVIQANDCAIIAPSSTAVAIVAESSQELLLLKLSEPGDFVRLSGSFRDARLRTRSGDQMHVTKRDLAQPQQPFGRARLWCIMIGSRVHRPYSADDIDEIRAPELWVGTEIPLRFVAKVQYPNKTVTRLSHVNAEELGKWLKLVDSTACSLEVDAGSFGIIRISSAKQPHQPVEADDGSGASRGLSRNAPNSGTRRGQRSALNALKRPQWSSSFMALRADGEFSRPYWMLGGRRNPTGDWRIQR